MSNDNLSFICEQCGKMCSNKFATLNDGGKHWYCFDCVDDLLENHDCHKSPEDGCVCDSLEVYSRDEWSEFLLKRDDKPTDSYPWGGAIERYDVEVELELNEDPV